MPIYEYKCNQCEKVFERLCFAGDDDSNMTCPSCDGKDVERLMSSFCSVSSGSGIGKSGASSSCAPSRGFS